MDWRIILFFGVLLGMQALVYFTFINYWKTIKLYKPVHKWLALAPFLIIYTSFIVISIIWGRNFSPPEWFRKIVLYPSYVWIAATYFIAIWLLIGKLLKLPFQIPVWIAKIFKPIRLKIHSVKQKKAVRTVDFSRRKFVRYTTMGISTYAFAGATYGMLKHDSYEIDYKNITINNLPPELKGTTITLLSDIHAGQYMNEKEMREYADVINSLESDIVCIPGDFVNFESRDIHMLTRAFRDVKARHGIYGSLGNHDFFQDADYVAKAINNESPIQLLRNEHRVINIKGKELYMLGIDDTQSSGAKMEEVLKYYGVMDEYLKNNDPKFNTSPKILLCHKPYGFDTLATKEIDLILSGHTHGGQVVPIKFGNFNMSFAATVSKYIEGIYKIGKSNMYVSRGIGSVGLPIRINCPPEITKITLV